MFTINFSPVRSRSGKTTASINATLLTLNGVNYELSDLPDGATAKHHDLGYVSRNGNDYELTIRLTHGPEAPEATRFPIPVEVTANEWTLEYDYDLA